MRVKSAFDRLDQTYLNGLVGKAKQGDSNAFAELFASVSNRQLYYLTWITGKRETALEILPDVFISVMKGLASLTREDLFMPWISRISARACMERESNMADTDADRDLSQILNLPLAESQIMLMTLVQGLSFSETADLLNVSVSTVKRFVKIGRRHLTRNSRGGETKEILKSTGSGSQAFAAPSDLTTNETSEILDKVFTSCGKDPNNLPMDTLSSYAVYRKERFTFQRAVTAMAMFVFLMIPLLFILPGYTVSVDETGERGLPVYTVEVKSLIPIGKVIASIREHELPVYEAGSKEFTVEPTRNGMLNISVELVNRQSAKSSHEVTAVDDKAPELVNSETVDDRLVIKVKDSGIGVDYREVYAVGKSGKVYRPTSADEGNGVIFDYPEEPWDLYVPDHIGNTLHLAVKLGKQK